jgi:ribosomal protein L11 methyltransferase
MNWLQFRLETEAELVPLCEAALLELGAAAVSLEDDADQPLFAGEASEDTVWQRTRVSALFPAAADAESLWKALPERLRAGCSWRAEILEDRDWEREWMSSYRPLQIAEHFWLCPSWHTPPDPRAVNLMLDPGLAFGTGTHPTTAMCLERLAGADLTGLQVVDYGCGSGILAAAMLLLGAAAAVATDIDPQALTATRANAERNGIARSRLEICLPAELDGAARRADLVVANILAGPLCELAGRLVSLLKPRGRLLLSGILEEQAQSVRSAYALPLEIVARRDGWVVLEGGG